MHNFYVDLAYVNHPTFSRSRSSRFEPAAFIIIIKPCRRSYQWPVGRKSVQKTDSVFEADYITAY